PMNGVAVVNQLLFVFTISIFGGVSGAGIYGAQYFGRGDHKGVRDTLRFKLLCSVVLTLVAIILFRTVDTFLISSFLHEGSQTGNIDLTLQYGREYLSIMVWGLLPFALSQAYSSTLREGGQTRVPMFASLMAVFINLCLNYVLIFGKLGFQAMGVRGAAIATIIARWVEGILIVGWTHSHESQCPFAVGLYKNFHIPGTLVKGILKRGMPLLLNEVMWSIGMTLLAQSYSLRGLATVAAHNISSTISNMFNMTFFTLGSTIAIVVGNLLGAGKMKEAKRTDTWMIVFSVMVSIAVAMVLAIASPLFPMLYDTTQEVRELARDLLILSALFSPIHAFANASYFTLRSGGKTVLTSIFDSGLLWCFSVPLAFFLSRYTNLPIRALYTVILSIEIIKCILGYFLVRSNMWMSNIIEQPSE
ncbi:MAG: MATE family efflux transporter, partial [Clostridiaceae bacterium]|nr:MATE family efflux transporter [Clostridiaceae bacterium]